MHYLKFYKILENVYKSDLFSLGIKSFLENARCSLNIRYLNCKPLKERLQSKIWVVFMSGENKWGHNAGKEACQQIKTKIGGISFMRAPPAFGVSRHEPHNGCSSAGDPEGLGTKRELYSVPIRSQLLNPVALLSSWVFKGRFECDFCKSHPHAYRRREWGT